MKKIVAMSVLALALAFVAACGKKAVKEEPVIAPTPAPVAVQAPAPAPAVVAPVVDPKIAQAEQKNQAAVNKFQNEDYKGALKDWQDCVKLDPTNQECIRGIQAAKGIIENQAAAHK